MSIDIIRTIIMKYLNKKHYFIYYGTRGQYEKFYGEIIKVFPRTFIIYTDKGLIKSFSYSDFLIKNIRIVD